MEPELRGEPGGTQHPQRVVAEGDLRARRGVEGAGQEVVESAGRIHEHLLGQAQRHGVHGEVAAHQVVFEGGAELDHRLAGLSVVDVGPIGGDLHRVPRDARTDRAERPPDVPVGVGDGLHDGEDLVWSSIRGEVEVVDGATEERVAHRAADEGKLFARRSEGRGQPVDRGGGGEVGEPLNSRSDAFHGAQACHGGGDPADSPGPVTSRARKG